MVKVSLNKLTHINESGNAGMVDVGHKEHTLRRAVARTCVVLSASTFKLLSQQALPKGDALSVARIAGIMAAKQTHTLIPLCHPLPLSFIDVRCTPNPADNTVTIEAEARTTGQTGVEMEALTAAQIAALTLYDMCKAVQKDICITECCLLYKGGGKSGEYRRKKES